MSNEQSSKAGPGRPSLDSKSLEELLSRQYVTLNELATILNVEYRTARKYVRTNKLKAIKCGGQYRIYEEELRRFLTYGNLTAMKLDTSNLTIK
jgi:excisionase family DNA binding protein